MSGESSRKPNLKEPKNDKRSGRQSSPGLMVSIIAAAFVVFMVIFIYTGPRKWYRSSENTLNEARQRYTQLMRVKEAELARLRNQETLMARIKERRPNFDLWPFMKTILNETKLEGRANLENFKPRSDRRGPVSGKGGGDDLVMVQLKLSGVTLAELIDLFHKVYASNDLVVMYKLEYLRSAPDGKGLECNVTFLTPKA